MSDYNPTHHIKALLFLFCSVAQYDKEGLSDLNNLFVHLTNNAIQKTSDSYNKSCDLKWPMRQLKMYMISKYGKKRVEECFYEIEMVMIRALLAVSFLFFKLKRGF